MLVDYDYSQIFGKVKGVENGIRWGENGCRPTLAFSRAAVVDRECLEHMIAHKIGPISLDAQRRRLERNVRPFLGFCLMVRKEHDCRGKAS